MKILLKVIAFFFLLTNFSNADLIKPDINNLDLTRSVVGIDEKKQKITTKVIHEKPLTIFLNRRTLLFPRLKTNSLGEFLPAS